MAFTDKKSEVRAGLEPGTHDTGPEATLLTAEP